ncbi:MAG TPA: UbiA family prenyltransferase, partial [Dehalococcoidia bacterium]|nr:UbiA family prenyltransferase [Dehalococcoidia bacterium]
PVLLFVAVTVWVAGFDLLYALQDVEFDRSTGLHSVPADLGIPATLWIARGMHVAMIAFLAWAGAAESLGVLYWIGLAVASALLIYEHQLVRPNDLSRLDVAFFNMNGYIAVTVFAFTLGGLYVG